MTSNGDLCVYGEVTRWDLVFFDELCNQGTRSLLWVLSAWPNYRSCCCEICCNVNSLLLATQALTLLRHIGSLRMAPGRKAFVTSEWLTLASLSMLPDSLALGSRCTFEKKLSRIQSRLVLETSREVEWFSELTGLDTRSVFYGKYLTNKSYPHVLDWVWGNDRICQIKP